MPITLPNDCRGDVRIRGECEADHDAVIAILGASFETDAEARLVADLRTLVDPLISLVAEYDDGISGCVLLTPVTVAGSSTAMGLGPLAVAPACQGRGIGSALVSAALEAASGTGAGLIFVLGHPDYYRRFGFEPVAGRDLHYRNAELDPWFLVAELAGGSLSGVSGPVHYHSLFERV